MPDTPFSQKSEDELFSAQSPERIPLHYEEVENSMVAFSQFLPEKRERLSRVAGKGDDLMRFAFIVGTALSTIKGLSYLPIPPFQFFPLLLQANNYYDLLVWK